MTKQTQLIIKPVQLFKAVQLLWLRVLLFISIVVTFVLLRSLAYGEGEVWTWSRVRSDDSAVIRTATQVRNEGTFDPGLNDSLVKRKTLFDISISLYNTPVGDNDSKNDSGSADDAQNRYEEVLQHFADAVCEQTNGQHRLGRVSVFKGGGLKGSADIVWQQNGRPMSWLSGFGINGRHIYMYDTFGDIDIADDTTTAESEADRQRLGYILGHEWGHYVYGLFDEHTGDIVASEDTPEYKALTRDGVETLESLMSDATQGVDATSNKYRWLNHSTSNNIGTLSKTVQGRIYVKSGWEVLLQGSKEDPKEWLLGIYYPGRTVYEDLTAPPSATGYEIGLPGAQAECRSDLEIIWKGVESTFDFIPGVNGDTVAFRPDPLNIRSYEEIAWGGGNSVYIKNLSSGVVKELKGHSGDVRSISFSRDGTQLASGSRDRTIRLWDVATGQEIHTLTGHRHSVNSLSYSPDGTKIASAGGGEIRLWNVATGGHIRTLTGHRGQVYSVSYSPDGTKLASGSDDSTIRLWDLSDSDPQNWSLIRTLTGHDNPVRAVSYSPDGTKLASGGDDSTIHLWDLSDSDPQNWSLIRTLTGGGSVYSVSYSPDGTKLASGSDDSTIRLWDLSDSDPQNWSLIRTLTGHTWQVRSVSYSPDGTQLASSGRTDNTIRLWNVATGQRIGEIITNNVSPAYSPDGTQMASGSSDYTIRLWDVATGQRIRTLTGHSLWVNSVSYSPDGTQLASGSHDKTIRLWDVATGRHLRTLTGHSDEVSSVSYSPDGTQLASGSCGNTGSCTSGEIRLWDVATGRHIRTLTEHSDEVSSVSYSPDGTQLASGSADRTIRLWDVATGRHLRTLTGHTGRVESVSYSPDGTQLASGSADRTIRLWDVATGRHLRTLTGHSRGVGSVSYSPDSTQLASAGGGEIRLWDVATGREIRTLEGHGDRVVNSVSYSPDGTQLASGSDDTTIRLWDLTQLLSDNSYNLYLENLSNQNVTYPQPILITMSLSKDLLITDANVSATITAPNSIQTTLDLNDDGLKGDVVSGDGIYSIAWAEYTQDGLYTIEATANNSQNTARYTSLGSLQAKLPQGTTISSLPTPPSINNETFEVTAGTYFIVQGVEEDDHTGDTTMPNTCTEVRANNVEIAGKIETTNDSDCFRITGTDNTNITADLVIRLNNISDNNDTSFLPTFRVYDRSGTGSVIAQWTATDKPLNGGLIVRIPAASIDRVSHIVEVSDGDTASLTAGGTYSISAGNPIVSDDPQYGPDATILMLSVENQSVAENTPQETLTITATLEQPVSRDVIITLDTTTESTATRNTDYSLSNTTTTITANTTTADITLTVLDDNIVEALETLSIFVQSVSLDTITNINDRSTPVAISITDNDRTTVSLELSAQTVSEGSAVTVRAQLTGATIAQALDLTLSPSVDTEDYTLSSDTLSIPVGQTRSDNSITITALSDNLVEETETLSVYIASMSVSLSSITNQHQSSSPVSLSLTDTDSTTVSLTVSSETPTEGNSVEVSATLPSGTSVGAGVEVVVTFGVQGVDPQDYALFTTVSIGSGQTEASVTLHINDDNIVEGSETLSLYIQSLSLASLRNNNPVSSPKTLTITDNDHVTVSLEVSSQSVTEGETVSVSAFLTGGKTVSEDVVLTLSPSTDTADYTLSASTLTIPTGQIRTDTTITLTTLTDNTIEAIERISVYVSSLMVGGLSLSEITNLHDSQNPILLSLIDADTAAVSLNVSAQTATEGEAVELRVSLTGLGETSLSDPVEITLSVALDRSTAVASDYTLATETVELINSQTETIVSLTLVDDTIVETTERLFVYISGVSLASLTNVNDNTAPLEISIIDNDRTTVRLKVSSPTITEGETVSLSAVLTEGTISEAVVLTLSTSEDPQEYTLSSTTLEILAGQTRTERTGSITLTAVEDTIVENTKTIELYVVSLSIGGGIMSSSLINEHDSDNRLKLVLRDNDRTTVSLTVLSGGVSSRRVLEGTTVKLVASFTGSTTVSEEVWVRFGVSGASSQDYSLPTATALVTANTQTATTDLTIREDRIVENLEILSVYIESVSIASDLLTNQHGRTRAIMLSLIDNDSVSVSLSVSHESVAEGESFSVEAFLGVGEEGTTTISEDLTVTLRPSVEENDDYTVTLCPTVEGCDDNEVSSSSLLIRAGQTRSDGSIKITTTEDNTVEAREETIEVYIEGLSISSSAIQSVHDRDSPVLVSLLDLDLETTVRLKKESVEGVSRSEDVGETTVSVTLDKKLFEEVEVRLGISRESTASSSFDYDFPALSVSIPAGETEVAVSLTIIDDEVVEVRERISLYIVAEDHDQVTFDAQSESSSLSVWIIDNDDASVCMSIVEISEAADNDEECSEDDAIKVSEDVGTIEVEVSLTKELSVSLDVSLSIGGDAQQGSDYRISGFTDVLQNRVTFTVGERTKTLSLTIIDDDVAELGETIELSIERVQVVTSDRVVEGDISGALTVVNTVLSPFTLSIEDDDGDLPVLSISASSGSVSEGEEGVTITISLDRQFPQPFSVELGHDLRSSTTYGEDYRFAGSEFTQGTRDNSIRLDFDTDETKKTIPLTIIDDKDEEENEEIILTFSNVTTNLVLISETSGSVSLSISASDSPAPECTLQREIQEDCPPLENSASGDDETTGSMDVYGMVLLLVLPLLFVTVQHYGRRKLGKVRTQEGSISKD